MAGLSAQEQLWFILMLGTLVALPQTSFAGVFCTAVCLVAFGFRLRTSVAATGGPASGEFSKQALSNVHPLETATTLSSTASIESRAAKECLRMLHVRDECSVDPDAVSLNSTTPVPFETDLFRGHVYFLLKTDPPNPTWQHLFAGRRRMFWIQVQGTLKRAPRGSIFLGGELPATVSVGLWARGLANMIMGIMQRLVGLIHYSFGDAHELPHCVFPLVQAVDELIMTPAGGTPPMLGQPTFGESKAAQTRRRQTPLGQETYEVGATYTFHFYTQYVDLTQWKIINLPGMQDMGLTTFFGSLPLRLACYDVESSPGPSHTNASKRYLFCFTVNFDKGQSAVPVDPATSSAPCTASSCSTVPLSITLPFWIEAYDIRARTRRVYFLVATKANNPDLRIVPAKQLTKAVPTRVYATSRLARYDAIDRQRRVVEASVEAAAAIAREAMPFACPAVSCHAVAITTTRVGVVVLEQAVLRAITDTFLRQEVLVLTTDALLAFRTSSSSPCKEIPRAAIRAIRLWTLPYAAMAHGLAVDTPSEVVYVVFPSADVQQTWLGALDVDRPRHRLLSPVEPWVSPLPLTGRLVLNSRRLFVCPSTGDDSTCCLAVADASVHAIRALALAMAARGPAHAPDETVVFLDAVSALRGVNLTSLVIHEDKVSFYLNVANCLRWHAENLPGGVRAVPRAAYRVGVDGHVLSLDDLEHGILRARLTQAKSNECAALAVAHPDFRLALALHVPMAHVPLFTPDQVHDQLNGLCRNYFQRTVATNRETTTIYLPMLCRDYCHDYGSDGSGLACVRKILGYLDDELWDDVTEILEAGKQPVRIKYRDAD
ncbi:Aste57867_3173 [Aphanomyces stellatus]|uniref:Aste57867_3173 protein n=1 Tax=Aphanomyces stellatus TaxID=120398 RepID=A0A485KA64_9STRA|nr:hypothetical protein As57867_003164 [Aphanomyces stellatus]VFT80347.1 Aste57867_3173 [Aphanomyces stellatus]